MKRLIIKVCGMREAENIRQIERLAPDWMGFICWDGSPRFVSKTPDYLPVSCSRTGVFVNPSVQQVKEDMTRLGLDIIQLHGKETPQFCQAIKSLRRPDGSPLRLVKAFGITADRPFPDTSEYEEACDYFLFDTRCTTIGGSGMVFDWDMMRQYHGKRPFLLSGGIGEEHIEALKSFSHPMFAGVDLNSRFEDSPAIKNVERLKNFIHQLREL